MLKNNQSIEQAAENVLRSYLIRCFSDVSEQYPQVSKMKREAGAEELLRLRNEKEIIIELVTVGNNIKCNIQRIN